jgi:hypothetical protein
VFGICFGVFVFVPVLLLEAADGPSLTLIGPLVPNQLPSGINYAPTDDCVDVAGNMAVVTAGIFSSGLDAGRAYVFNIAGPSPSQIAELRASDHSAGDEFGWSVAMTDRYVFVGAHGANDDRGAVYMYDMINPANPVERKITAFDAAPDNHFGYALATSGNRLIVAAPKFNAASLPAAAYVLDFSNPNNITQKKLLATSGSIGGNFAEQVDISSDGNFAIVGHISESSQFPFAGAAHLYDLTNLNNIRQKKLLATDSDHNAMGRTVAIDGHRALVSVSSDPGPANPPGNADGAVWAFNFSNWDAITQTEFGRQPVGSYSPPFGRGLDVVGTYGVLGAFNDGSNGAAYLYDVTNTSNPLQLQRVAGPPGSQVFSRSLEFDGRYAVFSDGQQHAYLYQFVPEPSVVSLALVAIGSTTMACRQKRRARHGVESAWN